jgi:isopropylmalate/homocitrate/citramalate synthase
MKNADIYNSFNSKDIFNRNIKIVVNQYSGVAGISGWINLYYDFAKDMRISKRDARVSLIKNLIDAEFDAGRTTAICDKEMVKFTEQIFGNDLSEFDNDIKGNKNGIL